jgi:hypothetical protein
MPLEIDWVAQVIQITSPTTEEDAQTLHDFIEDNMATPVGLLYGDIIDPQGKIEDPNNPGVYTQIILIFNSPWQIQFWGGSGYTRVYGGKFTGGLAGEVLKATGTAGDISVLESQVDGTIVVTSGGITPSDLDDIADAVWDESLADHLNVGSVGAAIMKALGLSGENTKWSNMSHNANHLLTAATITEYSDHTLATPLYVWRLTAAYNAQGRLTSYQMVEVP